MPRRPARPIQSRCSFSATLDAIDQLPPAAQEKWVEAYDWSLPVERIAVEGKMETAHVLTAGEVLLEHPSSSLRTLFLKPHRFAHADRSISRLKPLVNEAGLGPSFCGEAFLWQAALDKSLELGDVSAASTIVECMRQARQDTVVDMYVDAMTQYPSPRAVLAHEGSALQLKRVLDFCEALGRSVCRLGGVRKSEKPKHLDTYTMAWRHWMLRAAIRLERPALMEEILHRLEYRVAPSSLLTALAHGRFEVLEVLCGHAHEQGLHPTPEVHQFPSPQASIESGKGSQSLAWYDHSREYWINLVSASAFRLGQCNSKVLEGLLDGRLDLNPGAGLNPEAAKSLLVDFKDAWTPRAAQLFIQRFPQEMDDKVGAFVLCFANDQVWKNLEVLFTPATARNMFFANSEQAQMIYANIAKMSPEQRAERLGCVLGKMPPDMARECIEKAWRLRVDAPLVEQAWIEAQARYLHRDTPLSSLKKARRSL